MARRRAGSADDAEAAARERVETLFRTFDRLTPDDVARIGYRAAPEAERAALLAAVDEAAARTGRVGLVDEARGAAREAVLARYAAGTFRPTFIALNWGISQGTVESRVAIAEALADAAAAAAVADALDPEVAAMLEFDAASITGLATGEASEGSLARVLRTPSDPDLGPGRGGRGFRRAGAVAMVAAAAVAGGIGALGAAAIGVVAAVRALVRRGRRAG